MADKWYKEVKPVTSFDEIERQLKRNQFSEQARAQMGVRPKGEVDEDGKPVPNPNSLFVANAKAVAIGTGEFVGTPLMRALGYGEIADDMSRVNQAVQGAVGERDDETIIPNTIMRGGRGALTQIPGMIVGGTAGRLGPVAIAAGGEASRGYTQAIDAGESHSSAKGLGTLRAANEAATTTLFGKLGLGGAESAAASIGKRLTEQVIKEGGKDLVGASAAHIAKRAVVTGLQEIPEEVTIEAINAAIDYHYGIDPDALNAGELVDRAIDTAVAASMMGGGMGTLHGAVEVMDRKAEVRQPPVADPALAKPVNTADRTAPMPLPSDAIVNELDEILSDGKPRSTSEIIQEFVDRGHDMTEVGDVISYLNRQVDKGVIESTDDGRFYANNESDTDESGGEQEVSYDEYMKLNARWGELDNKRRVADDSELATIQTEMDAIAKRIAEITQDQQDSDSEDDTVSDDEAQPVSEETQSGTRPEMAPYLEVMNSDDVFTSWSNNPSEPGERDRFNERVGHYAKIVEGLSKRIGQVTAEEIANDLLTDKLFANRQVKRDAAEALAKLSEAVASESATKAKPSLEQAIAEAKRIGIPEDSIVEKDGKFATYLGEREAGKHEYRDIITGEKFMVDGPAATRQPNESDVPLSVLAQQEAKQDLATKEPPLADMPLDQVETIWRETFPGRRRAPSRSEMIEQIESFDRPDDSEPTLDAAVEGETIDPDSTPGDWVGAQADKNAVYSVDGDEGMRANVFGIDDSKFSVAISDTESGKTLDTMRIFDNIEDATAYADTFKPKTGSEQTPAVTPKQPGLGRPPAKTDTVSPGVQVQQVFKNAVRFSVDSGIPAEIPQKRGKRSDGVEYIEVANPHLDSIPGARDAIASRKAEAAALDIPNPQSFEELEALPKYSIYRRDGKDGERFNVRGDGKRGGGDNIFDTYEEAVEHAEFQRKSDEQDAADRTKREESERQDADREKAYVESFQGFDSGSPMKFGQSRKALEKKISFRGKPQTRKEAVELLVGEGREIVPDGDGLAIVTAKDTTFPFSTTVLGEEALGKTGIRYAQHLIKQAESNKQGMGKPAVNADTVSALDAITGEYKSLPAKTRELFESAITGKDATKLVEILHQGNKTLRAEFEARTGLKLPKTNKGTKDSIDSWAAGDTSAAKPRVETTSQSDKEKVIDYLLKNPKASAREISKATGIKGHEYGDTGNPLDKPLNKILKEMSDSGEIEHNSSSMGSMSFSAKSKSDTVSPPESSKTLPEGWTSDDVQFLRDKVASGEKVFIFGGDVFGLQTPQEALSGSDHMGSGVFSKKTSEYEVIWEAGGSSLRTPGGKSYTVPREKTGTLPYDKDAVLAALDKSLGLAAAKHDTVTDDAPSEADLMKMAEEMWGDDSDVESPSPAKAKMGGKSKPSTSGPKPLTKKQEDSIDRILDARDRIATGKIDKKSFEQDYETIWTHANRLGIPVGTVGTYFSADEYRKIANLASAEIAKRWGSHPTAKRRAARDAASIDAPPKPKAKEKAAAADERADDLLNEFISKAKGRLLGLGSTAVDPELASLAIRYVAARVEAGTYRFVDFAEHVFATIPKNVIDKARPYLEMAWKIAHRDGLTEDAGGDLATYGGKNREKFTPVGKTNNRDFANRPTDDVAKAALNEDKRSKYGQASTLPAGKDVALRIDIPAYNAHGVYVVTVHDDKGTGGNTVGTVIGYDSIASLDGRVRFSVSENRAAKIADNEAKGPIATVKGKFSPSKETPPDIENWHAIGMNPRKAPFFYDKKTGQEVRLAEDAISIGNTVFVRNVVEYGDRNAAALPSQGPSKLDQMTAEARQEVDRLVSQFVAASKKSASSTLPDPELMDIAIKLAKAMVKERGLTFAGFVKQVYDKAGRELTEKLGIYLETAWKVAIKRGFTTDPVGKTNEILKQFENQNEEDGASEGNDESGAVAGVGDGAGQSSANAPAETGVDASDGDSERGTSVESSDVLPGDGGRKGSDAVAVGKPDQGDGATADDSGNKSKLGGGKTAGRRGAKNADGVQVEDAGRNHVIGPDDSLAATGKKKSLAQNIAAIKLLKKLEAESRNATPEEKSVLSKFTSWGGISEVFDTIRFSRSERVYAATEDLNWKKQWGDAYTEVKELLTEEEWDAAVETTINAHYTSRNVIEGIWDVAEILGFTGGRVVELGAGIGHFAGLTPESVRDASKFTMVEMDSLSSRIMQKLYPEAETIQGDLNNIEIQPGKASLAVGNVPFYEGIQADSMARYGVELNLHNYFIARAIDALAPGGIGVVISSHATLDNRPEQRQFLSERADFLGAIRLPSNAFKDNAKTEVTTDILVFRKLDGDARIGSDIRDTVEMPMPNAQGKMFTQRINEYFVKNPDMAIGRHSSEGKLYTGNMYALSPIGDGTDLKARIREAADKLPKPKSVTETDANESVRAEKNVAIPEGLVEITNGKPTVAINGVRVEIKEGPKRDGYPANLFSKVSVPRARDYVALRDSYTAVRELMSSKDSSDADIKSAQEKMSKLFDAFVKKHGHMDTRGVESLQNDPGFYGVASLETTKHVLNEKTDKIETIYGKTKIFTERTIGAPNVPERADTVVDAVSISLNVRGKIDIDYVASLVGKSVEESRQELVDSGVVFIDPVSQQIEMRDEYLSGNVKKKLAEAKVAVKADPSYRKNIDELTKVLPEDKAIQQIAFKLSDAWIDSSVVQAFSRAYLRAHRAVVRYNQAADAWLVDAYVDSSFDAELGGTKDMPIAKILENTLNMKSVNVYRKVLDGYTDAGNPRYKQELNLPATAAAKRAQDEMQRAFVRLTKENEQQSAMLAKNYNERMNTSVATAYDGSHLQLPGKAASIELRTYQKNAIWRIIKTGRVMLAHAVGAGKTYTMIGAAMELKRLGLANRSLMVVQNATLGQFATSFMQMYPSAKVLVATSEDLGKENRQLFLNRMISDNWDAIVMAQSTYENLAPSIESESKFLKRRMEELELAVADATAKEGKKSPTVKQLVKNKNALTARIVKIQKDSEEKREANTVDFDSLDVDAIFLDEAHAYKKPFFITKIENLLGLNKEASGRGISTQVKLDSIRAKTGGRNVVLATGTPITNTLGEAYHMATFVAPEVNKQFGVETFDRFIGSFATVEPAISQNAGGAMVTKDAVKKFRNGDSLMQYLQSSWDILTPDMLRSYLIENPNKDGHGLPEIKGGKPETVVVERPEGVANFMNYILDVYKQYSELKGIDRRYFSWIPVVLTGASKTAAMDLRLIYPESKAEPGGKVAKAAEVILRDYHESMDIRGTQLVFSDIRNPRTMDRLEAFMNGEKAEFESEDSDSDDGGGADSEINEKARNFFFDQITAKLVAGGIPRNQIAYITDANTATQRDKLFSKVNSGEIRVLMGSTSKMGVGVNVQERVVSVHELDAVYVPADSEQRHGRAIRSGNMNKVVAIYRYAMKDTFDGVVFEASLRKSKFIWQALSGKAGNEFEDPSSEATVSLEEAIAAISGSPLPAEKFKLQGQLRDLVSEEESFAIAKNRARNDLRNSNDARSRINDVALPRNRERVDEFAKIEAQFGLETPVLVDGDRTITDPKEIEKFFANAYKAMQEQFDKDTKKFGDKKAGEYAKDFRSSIVTMNGLNVWLEVERVTGTNELTKDQREAGQVAPGRIIEVSASISLPSEPNLNLYFGSAKTGNGIFDAIKRTKEQLNTAVENNEQSMKRLDADIESYERQLKKEWDGGDKAKAIQKRLDEIDAELLSAGSLVKRHVAKGPVVVDISDTTSGVQPVVEPGTKQAGPSNELDQFLSPELQNKQSMGARKQTVGSAADLVENYANTPVGSSDSPYQFSDPEVQKRFKSSMKGLSPRSIWERLKDFAVSVKKNTVRGALAELPRTEENGDARAFFREIRDASHMAAWTVNSLLSRTVRPLQGNDMDLFTAVVILRDLKGRPGLKPFGLTQETAESELARFEAMIDDNPNVASALDYRKQWFDAMVKDYIDAHRKLGIDMTKRLKNEDYFRHQVLQYYMINNDPSAGGATRKAEVAMGRNFLKRAVGSELDINANYIQAEWEVASQMVADTKIAKLLYEVDQRYNIRDRLKKQAKAQNYENLAGGKKVVDRIHKLREDRATAKGAALNKINEELKKIDPLWEHRKQIAMNSARMIKAEPYLKFVDSTAFFSIVRGISVDPDHRSQERAVALLASVNAQEQFIRNSLGDKFLTWDQLIPEGYRAVPLQPGNIMFSAYTVPERMANQLFSDHSMQLGISADDLNRVNAIGPKYTPIVVPDDVADQMGRLSEVKGDGFHAKLDSYVVNGVRKWKGVVLLGPHRVIKYNLRNLSELDKVLFLNPSAAKPALLWRSAKELYALFTGSDDISADLLDWMQRGGASTLPIVNEMDKLGSEKDFKKFFEEATNASSIVTKPWKWYWKTVGNVSNYRESILRYSAYLAYLEQIKKNGKPNNYGGSNQSEIKGISDPKQKAFRLSADLLGDYGDLSPVGQWMRDRMVPFWAFQETNFRAYYNGVRNLAMDDRIAGKTGMKLAKEMGIMAITRSPWMAVRLGRVAILMGGLQVALHVFNNLFAPEEEKELPQDVQDRPHLTFPIRRADGSVIYFDRLGTSSDILDWFGVDTLDSDMRDVMNGRKTIKEVAEDMVMSPINKLVQGVTPVIKLTSGAATGKDLYPDVRNPRTIRDKGEYVAKAFGVDTEYRWLTGMPTRGLGDAVWRQFAYVAEPGSADYYSTLDLKYKWGEDNGAGGRGSFESPKSEAMRNYKQAVRYKDKTAAEKYKNEYFAFGGTEKGMEQSIAYLHPLSGLSMPKEVRFLATLTETDKEQLAKAEKFAYEALMSPEQAEVVKAKRANRTVDAIKKVMLNSERPNPKTNSDYENAIQKYEEEQVEIGEWLKENASLPEVQNEIRSIARSEKFRETANPKIPQFDLKVDKNYSNYKNKVSDLRTKAADAKKWRSLLIE